MRKLLPLLVLAFKDILRPRILTVLIVPFLGSFLFWGIFTWAIWDWIISLGFKLYNVGLMQRLVELLAPYFALTQDPLVAVTAGAFIVVVILPAALVTAMLITSIILVPILVSELRKTDFPKIIKKSNSIFAGTGVSLSYSAKYFFSWVGSLPFWVLIPGGAIVIPYLLLSWFNSRLFTWEVMTEISNPDEIKKFVEVNSRPLFLLGLMTSVLYYIPFLNLIAPVIVSAAFARYCLATYEKTGSIKIVSPVN